MQVSELVRSLLSKRGIVGESDVQTFLNPDYDLHTHSPFLLEGMEKAVRRLLKAIEAQERIAVYADFDCDGIPGAALISDFFKKIGYNNVEIYLPHRDREGYGFHVEAISELARHGVTLVITVDVGTNALAQVSYARQLGIDCIITDHHEITTEMPDAAAVLNPKLGKYPFRQLCGAAVAFKLVQAVLAEGRKLNLPRFVSIPEGWQKWLLDLVAIATIADLVELTGENRVLAYYGLRVLRRSKRPGILALCNRLRLRRAELTEDDIGFSIAPRINAASRMDEPEFAFRLLVTENIDEAEKLAAHLEELNAKRKVAVATVVREAKRTVKTRFRSDEKIIVLGNPQWKPALLGLAANSIMEGRGGMVCLWGRDASGVIKGSCRSDGSVSVVEMFSEAKNVFVEYGGHERSGGFTVSREHIHTIHEVCTAAVGKMKEKNISARLHEDAQLSLSDLSPRLFEEVSSLAPFGTGNPKPIFRIEGTIVTDIRRFGREMNHIEVMLECRRTGTRARSYDFFRAPDDFTLSPIPGTESSVLAMLERDSFRGGFALRVVDVLPR